MKILSVGKPFYNYPKSSAVNNKAFVSASKTIDADIFCFKGHSAPDKVTIIPSSEPTDLEKNIERNLGITPTPTVIKKFKNGETYINIKENIRGKDVYLMPASGTNVNDNLMETYLKADAAKRAGAEKVIAVMPSFDYARQEKRTEKGEPIAARLNMDLLKAAGVDEIITTDLHTPALEGFSSNQVTITHLESMPLMSDYIKSKQIPNLMVVSPDLGGTKRADKLAKSLGCEKAIVYKQRKEHNKATAEDLIGDVSGKNCIIYDDIIDTAGTIVEAAKLLKKNGANDIYICASHGLFNGDAMIKLQDAPVKEVIVTNSIPKKASSIEKIKQVDISEQVTSAILDISA
ncbi:ribose-phosphate pyrophosphokinase [bacterium]|nr:ribose-phosphate pyrophosphokinase [bacterium]